MIAIKDMEMPSCCMNCGLLGKEEMYCLVYPRKDLDVITVATSRPDWCPLVEIEERKVGKWVKSEIGGAKVCSICQAHMGLSNFKYCPNCGSKMSDIPTGSD